MNVPAAPGRTGRLKVSAQLSRMIWALVGALPATATKFLARRLAAPIQRTPRCSRPRRRAGGSSDSDLRRVERLIVRLIGDMADTLQRDLSRRS